MKGGQIDGDVDAASVSSAGVSAADSIPRIGAEHFFFGGSRAFPD